MKKESPTQPTRTNQIAMTPIRCLEEDETSGTYPSPPEMERKRYYDLATDGFLQLNQNQNFPSLFIPTLDHRTVHQADVEKDNDSTSFYLMPRKNSIFVPQEKLRMNVVFLVMITNTGKEMNMKRLPSIMVTALFQLAGA